MNLETPDPLDIPESLNISAGLLHFENATQVLDYSSVGYRGSLSGSKKLMDDQLGIVVGYSYQQQANGYPALLGFPYSSESIGDLNADQTGDFVPSGLVVQVKNTNLVRQGVLAKIQWQSEPEVRLTQDLFYSEFDILEPGTLLELSGFNDPQAIGSYSDVVVEDSQLVSATVANGTVAKQIATEWNQRNALVATGFNAQWASGNSDFELDLSYSNGNRESVFYGIVSQFDDPLSVHFDYRGSSPLVTVNESVFDPGRLEVSELAADAFARVDDRLYAIRFDGQFTLEKSVLREVIFGVRATERQKTIARYPGHNHLPVIFLILIPNLIAFSGFRRLPYLILVISGQPRNACLEGWKALKIKHRH